MPCPAQEILDALSQRQFRLGLVVSAQVALGHVVDPLLADQLLAIPLSSLKHQLAQFGLALGLQPQSPTSHIYAVGRQFPIGLSDVEWGENALLQVVKQALPRNAGDDGRQHMGTHRVIVELIAHSMKITLKPCRQPVALALKDA